MAAATAPLPQLPRRAATHFVNMTGETFWLANDVASRGERFTATHEAAVIQEICGDVERVFTRGIVVYHAIADTTQSSIKWLRITPSLPPIPTNRGIEPGDTIMYIVNEPVARFIHEHAGDTKAVGAWTDATTMFLHNPITVASCWGLCRHTTCTGLRQYSDRPDAAAMKRE